MQHFVESTKKLIFFVACSKRHLGSKDLKCVYRTLSFLLLLHVRFFLGFSSPEKKNRDDVPLFCLLLLLCSTVEVGGMGSSQEMLAF